jgi:cardiolipin synthase
MDINVLVSNPYFVHFVYVSLILTQLVFIARANLRPHRQPASRVAWVVVIAALPVIGIVFYILFGETNIGKNRSARARHIIANIPAFSFSDKDPSLLKPDVPDAYEHLFRTANSISGFGTFGGNSARLFSCSDETIQAMVDDIDNAQEHVHVLFYIWLPDNNGCKMVRALERAASRGVKCRAMVDGLGSRTIVNSRHWRSMEEAGVQLAVALPIHNILLKPFKSRFDLRNHRKIVVIDHQITYCGSQNCADAEFLVKTRYAPWVDAVMRFEGPIAAQQQRLFIADWLTSVDEDLNTLLNRPVQVSRPGFSAQAFGTGPTVRNSAMPEMFESLMFAARHKIVITTPYYIPDESLQNAICAAALRGVDTIIIFPARNDSFIVAAASHSYYKDLLEAGVKIYEYVGGLLHTKSVTIDGEVTLIGSANMDRRSFDLNYENNILLYDAKVTGCLHDLQSHYIAKSEEITLDKVAAWPMRLRLWNNTIAMMGPLL